MSGPSGNSRKCQLARLGARCGYEFVERAERRSAVDREHTRLINELTNRLETCERVIVLPWQNWIYEHSGTHNEQRIAVRRGAGHGFCSDCPSRAWPVLDYGRHALCRANFICQNTRQYAGCPARREW